ncbi:helix-turn-helix domain-containing protein [Streptomyces sp. NPDC005281]|uniref:helix-turn-helix domain-containing protein n=1 Tax=Streptomyces sp. NPDC005281 TaxID=3155712 RepID=UPI0033A0BD7C
MAHQDDAEEFAALLRKLKGRSDRSYAALARRLNMNASTLHRYCAGEAVPLGFAPVERFAAMCGASPAERVELHRRWILAVAARQRPRTPHAAEPAEPTPPGSSAGESASPTPAPTASSSPSKPPVPEPDPASPGSSPTTTQETQATRTNEETGETAAGTAGTVAETGETVAKALSPRTGPDTAEAPPPGTALASAPAECAPEGSATSPPEPAGVPRTLWYRRRVTVVAAVVTALLATLGSLSALPSGHSAKDAGRRVADAPAAKAAGARRGSATPSASPSAAHGRPSSSPTPSASGSRDSSPSASTSPSPTGVSAGPPLTWTVNSHRWAVGCGHVYVIDKAPEQVPPPPAPQDASPWARTQNAVHGEETLVDITVQGRSDAAVVLEALRVRVVGRSAPLKGTAYSTGGGCGGAMAPGAFTVDLDINRPIAQPVSGEGGDGERLPARRMPYRVSVKDPEVLMIDAQTVTCDCRWYLELEWSSRGRTGTARIDDDGQPFRTSSIKGLPHYWYGQNGWTPVSH